MGEDSDQLANNTTNTEVNNANNNKKNRLNLENIKEHLINIQPIELVITFGLFSLGIYFSYSEFHIDGENDIYWMYFMIFVGVILGAYIWIKATNRFFGRFIYYLVEHKISRKIFAGGDFSYIGYIDRALKNRKRYFLDPVKQLLSLTIVFVGIASMIIGFLGEKEAGKPLVWGGLAILVPLLATPLVPVLWSLQDANVKSYSKGKKTTWGVAPRYRNRYNSIITFGAVFANLRNADSGFILDEVKIFIDVLRVGFLVMLISVSLFMIIYYGWFKQSLSDQILESLDLRTYDVILREYDDDIEKIEGSEDVVSGVAVRNGELSTEMVETDDSGEGEIITGTGVGIKEGSADKFKQIITRLKNYFMDLADRLRQWRKNRTKPGSDDEPISNEFDTKLVSDETVVETEDAEK